MVAKSSRLSISGRREAVPPRDACGRRNNRLDVSSQIQHINISSLWFKIGASRGCRPLWKIFLISSPSPRGKGSGDRVSL